MKYPLIDLSIATCKWHNDIYTSNEELQQIQHTHIHKPISALKMFIKYFSVHQLVLLMQWLLRMYFTWFFVMLTRIERISMLSHGDDGCWFIIWFVGVGRMCCHCNERFFLDFDIVQFFFEFVSFSGFLDLCWLNVGFIAYDGFVLVCACIISLFSDGIGVIFRFLLMILVTVIYMHVSRAKCFFFCIRFWSLAANHHHHQPHLDRERVCNRHFQ